MDGFGSGTIKGILVRRGAICWLAGIALSYTAVLLAVFTQENSLDPRALLVIPIYTLIGAILTAPVAIMVQVVVNLAPQFFVRSPFLAGLYAAFIGAAAGFAILYMLGLGGGWRATAKMAAVPAMIAGGLFGLWGHLRPLDLTETRS